MAQSTLLGTSLSHPGHSTSSQETSKSIFAGRTSSHTSEMSPAKLLIVAAMAALLAYAAPAPTPDKLVPDRYLEGRTTVSTNSNGFPSGDTLQKPVNTTGIPSGFPSGGELDARDALSRMFHIPAGQKNGVYNAFMDDDGKEVHQRVGSLSRPPQGWLDHSTGSKVARNMSLLPRENVGANCPEVAAIMDQSEVERAAYNLGSACDNGGPTFVKPRSAQYALSANAIVFTCNHMYETWFSGTNARACSTSEVTDSITWVEDKARCSNKEGKLFYMKCVDLD